MTLNDIVYDQHFLYVDDIYDFIDAVCAFVYENYPLINTELLYGCSFYGDNCIETTPELEAEFAKFYPEEFI